MVNSSYKQRTGVLISEMGRTVTLFDRLDIDKTVKTGSQLQAF